MKLIDDLKVKDSKGFVHKVNIIHYPLNGVSIANHNTARITSREYGKFLPPDSDREEDLEKWETRFREFADGVCSDLERECKSHFDRIQK